ncbi:MAG: peptidyl-prolyl cis-trans isomerase, partial [Fibrobacter sp.]|nr:peptidyl-prolyl cis-trans isomerase [Fibrobacter sp.]
MKKIYSLVVLALCSLLVACNGIGSKDTLVARIGNESLYAEDLDFLVVQNYGQPGSEKYQSAAENHLFSLAKVSKVTGESASYDSAWKVYETVLRDRLLSIVYTRFHLMSRLGYTDEELKKFFNEHRSEFDSAATYIAVREEVAGRYYLSQNRDSLKRFIQQALPEKDVPANVELLFFMGDSLAVSEIAGKLNGNVPEDSMQNVRHIMVAQGKEQGVFADSSVMGALFFADSMKVGESRSFRVMQDSSLAHFVLKVQKRTPAVKAREEDYVKEFEQAFIGQQKQAMSQKVQEMVSDLGSVVFRGFFVFANSRRHSLERFQILDILHCLCESYGVFHGHMVDFITRSGHKLVLIILVELMRILGDHFFDNNGAQIRHHFLYLLRHRLLLLANKGLFKLFHIIFFTSLHR